MGWIAGGVWIGAALLAAVVLTFCAYEVHWKSRRLQTDLERLNALSGQVATLQADVAAVRQRTLDTSG